MNLAPVLQVRPGAKPWQFCVRLQQKRASEFAWMQKGTETTAVWAVGAVQTQTAHGLLCETEGTNNALTLQTLPAVQSEFCVCMCEHTRARVNALVPVHNCSHIQIWRHTLSQCSLFNFHRYVNSSAKARIWCIRKVYPKGEES